MDSLREALSLAESIKSALIEYVGDQSERNTNASNILHPFDLRNLHDKFGIKVKKLFDDGHYSEATFEATKYLEKCIRTISGIRGKTGYALIMDALNEENPKIALTNLSNDTEKDEQRGLKFLFAGVAAAIRNPRGHESDISESPDECLDHVAICSFLLRRIEAAGHSLV